MSFVRNGSYGFLIVLSIILVSFSVSATGFFNGYDFGGMYGQKYADSSGLTQINMTNPATGGMSCPSGYSSRVAVSTSYLPMRVTYCYRNHIYGRDSLYDFGGMYGYSWDGVSIVNITNPATGKVSCPLGYNKSLVTTKENGIPEMGFCYRKHVLGKSSFYNFGGMYGPQISEGVTIGNYTNPATGKMSCPCGYKTAKVLTPSKGTSDSAYFCYN